MLQSYKCDNHDQLLKRALQNLFALQKCCFFAKRSRKFPIFPTIIHTKTPNIQFNPKLTLIPFSCQTMLHHGLIFSIEPISDWKDFHTASYIYCYAFIFRPYILKILTICMKLYEIPACTHIINVWRTEILPDIGLFHFSATNTFIQTGQGTF